MRPGLHVSIALISVLAAALSAGAGFSQTPTPVESPAAEAAKPVGPILTPQANSSQNVKSIAESPLSDLNLVRQKIPPILQAAVVDPYAPLGHLSCRTLTTEITRLYAALGPDLDDPSPPQDHNVTRSGGTGLKLMHNAAQWLIPGDGFLRTLSGAQRRDQRILDAINAGDIRRGYLKGLGESRHCSSPAAPLGHAQSAGLRKGRS